jgi:hypothetical protein
MADKFDTLKRLLVGKRAQYKSPTERPGLRAQKRAFDTFAKAATSLYNQALAGSAERAQRIKDYEEMDQSPEITKALDIYADDSCTYDEAGTVLSVVSDNERIKRELEELYYERLDIEFHMWNWIRNMCKYGDHFNLLDIVEKEGVLGAISLPVMEVEREEGYNGDPNSLRFKWTAQGNTVFENYQISHLRILGDDRFLPYGRSMLDSGRKIWKQLQLAEDAMLIYRLTRAPERRVFYLDVANIPPNDVEQYIMQARDKLKRTPLVTEATGQIDYRYNPMSIDEDFFIPVRGDRGSRIETLPGGTNQGDIEDVEYIQNKMFIALGVPKSYLTAEEDLGGKGQLAQEDIKFARTIQRIQKIVVSELAKIGLIHLYLRGFAEEDIYNFDLKLTNPSTVMEMMQLDLVDRRFSIARDMADSPLVSDLYVQKNILRLSDQEITDSHAIMFDEARRRHIIDSLEGGEETAAPATGPDGEGREQEQADRDLWGGSNPSEVPDPAGTKNIPGASNYEATTKVSLRKPNKKKRKRDPFSRSITDALKFDREIDSIVESLETKPKIVTPKVIIKNGIGIKLKQV